MRQTKRIVLNTLATYGRSVFALALGLFSARWVLQALGKEDLGLFGVVGSILVCVTFVNAMMSAAVSRFYAFAVGEERLVGEKGRTLVVEWFNAALSVHLVLPFLLLAIGYPVGIYAIRHWLVVPEGRLYACEVVFKMSLLSAFFNIVSVPFVSMYRAYQLITELSFWGIVTTLLTFLSALALLRVDGDRLIAYGVAMSLISVAVNGIQVVRACRQFRACTVRWSFMFNRMRIRKLFGYSFWEFFGVFGDVVRGQGTVFLINRHLGAALNAAYSIGNSVCAQTQSLASAMLGALQPAIATTAGEGDRARAVALAARSSKFSAFLILLFCVPLLLEMDEVLRLWLVEPPEGTAAVCRCILVATVCHKLGIGQHMLVCSYGKIAGMQFLLGMISLATVFLVLLFLKLGWGIFGVGMSFVISYSALTGVRVLFARRLYGASVGDWLAKVAWPVLAVCAGSLLLGAGLPLAFEPSLWRVLGTGCVTFFTSCLIGWLLVFDAAERGYVLTLLRGVRERVAGLSGSGRER